MSEGQKDTCMYLFVAYLLPARVPQKTLQGLERGQCCANNGASELQQLFGSGAAVAAAGEAEA